MSEEPRSEALEPEPPEAAQVFGDRLPVVRRYVADLAEHGIVLGLIGPLEPSRLWSRHVVNSGLLSPFLPQGATVADVGSGAGLPGLVIAAARPDLRVTLIEPMERRVAWLEEETARLGLKNVVVERSRAEDAPRGRFDVVTARAVGALSGLLPITAPLARPGGRLALLKGASVEAEIAKAEKAIRRLGLEDVHVEIAGRGMASLETRVLVATLPV
ncbi:16S rRNA (guanine(527)-N(7))-methyltransferase RsmG [Amnibacterium setariae]|uniref:Ribosomal RNA small subunit methyltransferase G n=1 Tax=Amnibacterium setariae TaxID=2306585 RepID=A0A3A1U3R0_9MICO|nr:16S rRNA (guanine(527)-N(7))-methyltransferase RsmG [Amnibacterium setariae]RIX30087.1 16S rRNA (guanine(527)-N(7))-methyltransferase RsmG [Amnibacterium setariae]